MKSTEQIPYYTPDGTSLGFRSLDATKRLIAGGFVKPSYGRKGHLKAIWLRREDGSNPWKRAHQAAHDTAFWRTSNMAGAGSDFGLFGE
jgi:hypothetical protein